MKETSDITPNIVKGASITFIGISIDHVLSIVHRVVLARLLGPKRLGLISLGLSMLTMATIFSLLGFGKGVARFIAYYNARNEDTKVRGILASAFKTTLPVGCIFAVVFFIFSENITNKIFGEADLASVVRILSVAVPIYLYSMMCNAGLRGLKKIKEIVLTMNIFWRGLPLVVFLPLYMLGFRTIGAAYAYVTAILFMAMFSGYFLYKSLPTPKIVADGSVFRELVLFSLPLAPSIIMDQIRSKIDIFLLGYFLSAREVGIYSVAITITALLPTFLSAFIMILGPVMTELHSKGKNAEFKQKYRTVSLWIFYLTTPIALFIVFFANSIVNILFGSDYADASVALMILTSGFFIYAIFGTSGLLTWVLGKTTAYMVINIISAISGILLNIALIPKFGVIGAAIATSTSLFICYVGTLLFIYHFMAIQPFGVKDIKYLLASLAIVVLFRIFLNEALIYWRLLAIVPIYIASISSLFPMKQLSREDIVVLSSIANKFGIKLDFWEKFVA